MAQTVPLAIVVSFGLARHTFKGLRVGCDNEDPTDISTKKMKGKDEGNDLGYRIMRVYLESIPLQ